MSSSEEKTEKPTARKLRKSREEGNVGRSVDVSKTVAFLAIGIYLFFQFRVIAEDVGALLNGVIGAIGRGQKDAYLQLGLYTVQLGVSLLLPMLLLVAAASMAFDFLQVGPLLAIAAAMPKLERIHPAQGFKRLFSKRSLTQILMSIAKMASIGLCLFFVVKSFAPDVLGLPKGSIGAGLQVAVNVMAQTFLWSALCLIVLAIIDYMIQRRIWYQEQYMSKTELKREQKDDSPSKEVQEARKEAQGDDPLERMYRNLGFCQVMVLDGAGSVLGLYDNPEFNPEPLVLIHASGVSGEKLLTAARAEDIRVVKDARFATAVFAQTQPGQPVPSEFQARARQLIASV
jgi:flagellar biosynthesis protein FlhB